MLAYCCWTTWNGCKIGFWNFFLQYLNTKYAISGLTFSLITHLYTMSLIWHLPSNGHSCLFLQLQSDVFSTFSSVIFRYFRFCKARLLKTAGAEMTPLWQSSSRRWKVSLMKLQMFDCKKRTRLLKYHQKEIIVFMKSSNYLVMLILSNF